MLPDGWTKATVADACESVSVGIVINPSSYYVDEAQGIRAFRSGNVRENKVNDDNWVFLSEAGHRKNKKSILRTGDVLVVRTGFAGTACVLPPQYDGTNCIDILFARPKKERLLPEYLSQLTNSELGRRQVFSGQNGLAQKHLNVSSYEKMSFGLPTVAEQRRISNLLDVWDKAIATTERLLANSRKQKQALMARFLRGSDEWKAARLDSIATRITRESEDGENPVLMISASTGFVPQSEMYSRFMAGKSLGNYIQLNRGEFAYNKGNSKTYEFGCVYSLENFARGLVPHVYVCFSLDETVCFRPFYKYLFEADYLHDQLGALVNTGVRNNGLLNIRPADFFSTRVPVPPIEVQQRIAAVLDSASESIRKIEDSLLRLKTEKSALMQQLLTGKRRVRLPARAEAQRA